MAGSYGTLIMIAVIAALFYFASPGIMFNYSIDGDNQLVDDSNRPRIATGAQPPKYGTKANKIQVATHAIAFGIAMTFAFPIIKETLGRM
jgi:hypothetical protein